MYAKSQVADYSMRGEELSDMNVFNFFMNTYEENYKPSQRQEPQSQPVSNSDDEDVNQTPQRRPRGRPKNQRVEYQSQHPRSKQKIRVVRTRNHNNLPNIVGRWFPRRDDPAIYPFYCASMLLLLKPWRNLNTDLKGADESWEEAFERFSANADARTRLILSSIQY